MGFHVGALARFHVGVLAGFHVGALARFHAEWRAAFPISDIPGSAPFSPGAGGRPIPGTGRISPAPARMDVPMDVFQHAFRYIHDAGSGSVGASNR
jgi:hypothetical protein